MPTFFNRKRESKSVVEYKVGSEWDQRQFLYAAMKGDKTELEKLLKKGDIDINRPNSHGETALFLVSGNGSFECVKLLLDNGADPRCLTKSKQSVLHNAAVAGNEEILVHFHAEEGLKIDQEAWDGSTELILAARANRSNVVSYLIQQGADLNHQDLNGRAALHHAIDQMSRENVAALCEVGANTNLISYVDAKGRDIGESPLHVALRKNSPQIIQLLISCSAKLNCCQSCRKGKACSSVPPVALTLAKSEIKERKKVGLKGLSRKEEGFNVKTVLEKFLRRKNAL